MATLICDVGFDPVDAGACGSPARWNRSFMGELAYEGEGSPEVAYRFERFGQ